MEEPDSVRSVHPLVREHGTHTPLSHAGVEQRTASKNAFTAPRTLPFNTERPTLKINVDTGFQRESIHGRPLPSAPLPQALPHRPSVDRRASSKSRSFVTTSTGDAN